MSAERRERTSITNAKNTALKIRRGQSQMSQRVPGTNVGFTPEAGSVNLSGGAGSITTGGTVDPIVQTTQVIGGSSGTVQINAGVANYFTLTLNGDVSLEIVDAPTGQKSQVLTLEITQDATGEHAITWPDNVSGTPSIPNSPGEKTIVVLLTFDGGTVWHYATIQGGSGGSGGTGVTALSQLVIDAAKDWGDYTISNIQLEDVDGIGFKSRVSTPAYPAGLYRSGNKLIIRSNSVNYELEDFWTANIISSDNGKFLKAVNGDPVWEELLVGIADLTDYTPASGGNAAYLTMPSGAEIRDLSRLRFATSFISEVNAFTTPTVKTNEGGQSYVSEVRGVMDLAIVSPSAIDAISNVTISARQLSQAPWYDQAAVEVKANQLPSFKLVDYGWYTDTSSVLDRNIGNIHFDAFANILDQNGNVTERVQTTFVQLKASAEKGNVVYATWSEAATYQYGDQVTYNEETYRCLVKLTQGTQPDISINVWYKINENVLDRGKLEISLRDIDRNTIGGTEDIFNTIVTFDIDSGVFINHDLRLPPTAFAEFLGGVSIGSPAGNAEGYRFDVLAHTNLHSNDIYQAGRLNFATVTPSGFNGSIWYDGTSVFCRISDTVTVDLSNIGSTNPNALDLSAVAQDYIPDKDDEYSIGTADKRLGSMHTDALYLGTVGNSYATLNVNSDALSVSKPIRLAAQAFEVNFTNGQTGLAIQEDKWIRIRIAGDNTNYYIPVYQ